jgi:hypothetical protein
MKLKDIVLAGLMLGVSYAYAGQAEQISDAALKYNGNALTKKVNAIVKNTKDSDETLASANENLLGKGKFMIPYMNGNKLETILLFDVSSHDAEIGGANRHYLIAKRSKGSNGNMPSGIHYRGHSIVFPESIDEIGTTVFNEVNYFLGLDTKQTYEKRTGFSTEREAVSRLWMKEYGNAVKKAGGDKDKFLQEYRTLKLSDAVREEAAMHSDDDGKYSTTDMEVRAGLVNILTGRQYDNLADLILSGLMAEKGQPNRDASDRILGFYDKSGVPIRLLHTIERNKAKSIADKMLQTYPDYAQLKAKYRF